MTADRRPRAVESIVVPRLGGLREVPELPWAYEVVDASGEPVGPVTAYLRHLAANDCPSTTTRSYGLALLRWWRFLAAIETPWDRASRDEFVDHVLWMRTSTPTHGGVRATKPGFAARTINHAAAVISGFYEFHAENGTGPLVNPTANAGARVNAHHNPMQPFARGARTLGRQKLPKAAPQSIPDEIMNYLFAGLRCDRDRAIIGMFLSTGARATELLTLQGDGLDFGNHRIRVRRKGSREYQWLPASPDSFVWLRLYLGKRRIHTDEAVWLTLRKPLRPLAYPACRQVFERAQTELGTTYTLHQLRHTAAYRMLEDPNVLLTDVQWVLGHASLLSTQIYVQARPEDVLTRMAEHHRRPQVPAAQSMPAFGYDADTLSTLFEG